MSIAGSAIDKPTILGCFYDFDRRYFEIYPTGVGFLFDLPNPWLDEHN